MEIMEDLRLLFSFAGTVLGLFISTLTFLSKYVKSVKLKKQAYQIIDMSKAIVPFIEEAEKFTNYTGAEKKAYVMTKTLLLCSRNKMKIGEDQISQAVEDLIALTRNVNIGSQKTEKELQKLYT